MPDAFPPLARSDYLNADKVRAIKTVTGGLEQKSTVNGKAFNGVMPAWDLSDEDIANVLTYRLHQVGNSGQEVTPEEVKPHRVKAQEQARGLRSGRASLALALARRRRQLARRGGARGMVPSRRGSTRRSSA